MLIRIFNSLKFRTQQYLNKRNPKNYFIGLYDTFSAAEKKTSSFASDEVFDKIKKVNHEVREGKGVYESNGLVVQAGNSFTLHVIGTLLISAVSKRSKLNLVDFGGSMGTMYYQHKQILDNLSEVKWNIVEQKHYVDYAQKHFETESLKFFHSIDDCFKNSQPTVFLASGSLQYLPDPFEILQKVVEKKFEYVLITLTPFYRKKFFNNSTDNHKITIQSVDTDNYKASFPSWLFKEEKFLNFFFENNYEKLFDQPIGYSVSNVKLGLDTYSKFIALKLKTK